MFVALVILGVIGVVVVLAWQMPEPGLMRQARNGLSLLTGAPTNIPQPIREDALAMAKTLHRHDRVKQLRLASDMLATYQTLENTNILVLFNSGGYGWTSLDKASGYATIINAIESHLVSKKCSVSVLSYQRAFRSLRGYISEILNAGAKSIAKPSELALRLRFLWNHLPNLKVLLTAESNGTVMSNQVMRLMADESRLFSIEFGPPFWYKAYQNGRIMNLRSNGTVPDAFSYGHWRRAIMANIAAIFGRNPKAPGNVLLYIGAPGHDYNWHDYPLIREKVLAFLAKHFDTCKDISE
ncbi:hypothetical protein DGWBC_1197 [Dehalogenimonas sp. WBC-2]|nr:hypothetical protein DGWBC_1197 [Dehalogenimonas sp. WBC-2]